MSWLYLPAQVEDCSLPNTCSDGKPSATSKTQPIQSGCSRPGSKTATSTTLQSGATSEPSTEHPGVDAWISSLLASRASPGQQEASTKDKSIPATSGPTPFALLEKSSPRGYYWRTLQSCFIALTNTTDHPTSPASPHSWPPAGTWDNGAAYPLPPLDSNTNGNGCGLLPTPVTRDGASFYVTTYHTALRIMHRKGSTSRQLHWSQYGTVFHDLKKGWANPRFSELMMGWPTGWTDLQPLARARFRQWLQQLGES